MIINPTMRSERANSSWLEAFSSVRRSTEDLCAPLSAEDCVVQSMPDASPAKWHLAHTTWFFETFILESERAEYSAHDPHYRVLFNSYYNTVGTQHPRPQRGLLSRPTLDEVMVYRRAINDQIADWLAGDPEPHALAVLEVGLQHEQQHQELLLMDIKHLFSCNPLGPAYHAGKNPPPGTAETVRWVAFEGGLQQIGHRGAGYAFDNETPAHRVYVAPYQLAERPVSNAEFLAFIDDNGYERPELWLADGWTTLHEQSWNAPAYWYRDEEQWYEHSLSGPRPIDLHAPVCHVSYYEADAYARWAGARLPIEAEWEIATQQIAIDGNLLDCGWLHPVAGREANSGPRQMFGDVWEWTASAYAPYPGYQPPVGALGEYNGQFMCNQMVLRGGCCVTPANHIRATYRNFFYPHNRWQFGGIRLAKDLD
jgi:ergothioneine biosynthesis protein EgtB